jgi:hypothetical protein
MADVNSNLECTLVVFTSLLQFSLHQRVEPAMGKMTVATSAKMSGPSCLQSTGYCMFTLVLSFPCCFEKLQSFSCELRYQSDGSLGHFSYLELFEYQEKS